jgi:hypothetical protein
MPNYKALQIDQDVYDKLKAQAEAGNRGIKDQVRFLVDRYDAELTANRLLFSTDPDIASLVVKEWLEETRLRMVERLEVRDGE